MNYLVNNRDERNDIIYIGASMPRMSIDPCVIDTLTGLKGYNFSFDACSVVYLNMILSKYMHDHPTPKYVVLVIDQFTLANGNKPLYYFHDFQPYIGDSIVSSCLLPYCPEYLPASFMERYTLFQKTVAKTDFIASLFKNLLMHIKGKDNPDKGRGFRPDDKTWESMPHGIKPFKESYPTRDLIFLQQMCSLCEKKGVKLIWITPPLYKDYRKIVLNYDELNDSIKNLAKNYHIPYWIYTDIYMGQDSTYFYNVEHMNAKAAPVFSNILGEDIKNYMVDSNYTPNMSSKKPNY